VRLLSEFYGEGNFKERHSTVSFKENQYIVKYYDNNRVVGFYAASTEQSAEAKAEDYVLGSVTELNPDEYQGGVEYFG